MDPIQQRLFNNLESIFESSDRNTIRALANNLNLLIKYKGGLIIEPDQIIITKISNRGGFYSRITVSKHERAGGVTVVASAKQDFGFSLIMGLTVSVDKTIEDILSTAD